MIPVKQVELPVKQVEFEKIDLGNPIAAIGTMVIAGIAGIVYLVSRSGR